MSGYGQVHLQKWLWQMGHFLSVRFFPHCDFHSRWYIVVIFFYLDLSMFVLSVPRIRLSTSTQPTSKWWGQRLRRGQ